jgi:hypothetical protein
MGIALRHILVSGEMGAMMHDVLSLFIVTIVVVIDNALLAGLLLPSAGKLGKIHLSGAVAVAVAVSQVVFAVLSQHLLEQDVFRYAAMIVLIVMSIQTLQVASPTTRGFRWLRSLWTVYLYTAIGNIDNMIWLGVEMGNHIFATVLFSILTIPLFVGVALFLSYERERHRWVVLLGAGMPAWAAVTLFLHSRIGQQWIPGNQLWLRVLITAAIVLVGMSINHWQLRIRRPPRMRL